jgi:hypothetical protein
VNEKVLWYWPRETRLYNGDVVSHDYRLVSHGAWSDVEVLYQNEWCSLVHDDTGIVADLAADLATKLLAMGVDHAYASGRT